MNPVPTLSLLIVLSAVLLALGLGCGHPGQPEAAPTTTAAVPTSATPGTGATVPAFERSRSRCSVRWRCNNTNFATGQHIQ